MLLTTVSNTVHTVKCSIIYAVVLAYTCIYL